MNDFVKFQSSKYARNVDDLGCEDSSIPRLTWSKIVNNGANAEQFDDGFKDAPRKISLKGTALKLWTNSGLKNVYYNSKGYYTFRFDAVEDMKKVLALNSVQIGGKRLYLAPWTDGANFQKNVIKKVSTWVKLVDVPHSYWTREGLKHIASAVGVPVSLDKQTATLNPMKYAGVLVEITYDCSYPKAVWVPVIDEDTGEVVKVRVGIDYSSVPQCCSYCKAFGHFDSRCEKNPSYVKPPTKEKAPVKKGKEKAEFMGCPVEKDPTVNPTPVQPVTNPTTPNPDVVGTSNKFSVLEEGEIVSLAETEVVGTDSEPVSVNSNEGNTMPHSVPEVPVECPANASVVDAPVNAPDAPVVRSSDVELQDAPVAPLGCSGDAPVEMEVDQGFIEVVCALPASNTPPICPQATVSESSKNKRKKSKGKGQNGPFFTESPQVSPSLASPSKRGKNVDEDGFTHIENKRSLRSRGKVTILNLS
ncbi:uncharacterized protein LOC135149469 [Daucus carota subsp. sativus]|uniref:uncharacterized protein LOC135149442 n=1 Tax=Daucus carota subsp. sativus TaxID=79200 RepID=UPI003083A45F